MASSSIRPSLSLEIPPFSPSRNANETREHVDSGPSQNQEQKRRRRHKRHSITWSSSSPVESLTSSTRPSTPEPHRPYNIYLPSALPANDKNDPTCVISQNHPSREQPDPPPVVDTNLNEAPQRGHIGTRRQSASSPRSRSIKALEISPGVFISASCQQHLAMRPPCEATQQPQRLEVSGFEGTSNSSYSHVMVLDIPNTVAEECFLDNWDKAHDDEILRHHYARRDIVLDSLQPHIAPHIVISTPEESSEDFYIPWRNRVDPQWPGFLMVPPSDVSITRMPCMLGIPPFDSTIHNGLPKPSVIESIPTLETSASTTRLHFSPSRFDRYVEETSNERLFMYYVVIAVRKHQMKAAAFAASALASSFRKRYDSPKYLFSIEKPFHWIDPAELVLSASRRISGTMIIDSPNPCTVPHILISSPPLENPWTAWQNATNDPQDAGFGHFLTVPFRPVRYINMPSPPVALSWHVHETEFHSSAEDMAESHLSAEDLPGDLSDSNSLSPLGSPGPETPVCIGAERGDFFSVRNTGHEDLDDYISDTLESLERPLKVPNLYAATRGNCSSGFAQTGHSIFDEDEEDLPEFDEWYQNIASRVSTSMVG